MKHYPPPSHLCPIYDYVNKWDLFYPPPSQIGQCLILGNFYFLKASLRHNRKLEHNRKFEHDRKIGHNEKVGHAWTYVKFEHI